MAAGAIGAIGTGVSVLGSTIGKPNSTVGLCVDMAVAVAVSVAASTVAVVAADAHVHVGCCTGTTVGADRTNASGTTDTGSDRSVVRATASGL